MTVVATNLTANGSSTAGTSFATASITPVSNNLILASISVRNGASVNPGNPTLSGNGLTWVLVASLLFDNSSSSRRSLFIYRALGASTTGAITITTAETDTNLTWSVDQFSGVNTSGTNGSGAVVQTATGVQTTSPAVTSITATLASFGSAGNATFGAFGSGNGNAITVGSGFTQLGQNASAGAIQTVTEFVNSNDTTVDFSFASDFELGCIGLEIKAATAAVANSGFFRFL